MARRSRKIDLSKPLPKGPITPEEMEKYQSLMLPVRYTNLCAKHKTMKMNGVCRRCEWAKNPKRKAIAPSPPGRFDQIEIKDTGKTVEVQ